MQKLWHWIIVRFFPGSLEEYYAAREIYRAEVKVYRRQPQFIVGMICFWTPLVVAFLSGSLSLTGTLALIPFILGFCCICDTIQEHYCLLLLRQSREAARSQVQLAVRPGWPSSSPTGQSASSQSAAGTKPSLRKGRYVLVVAGCSFVFAVLFALIRAVFGITPNSPLYPYWNAGLNASSTVATVAVLNGLIAQGRLRWLRRDPPPPVA